MYIYIQIELSHEILWDFLSLSRIFSVSLQIIWYAHIYSFISNNFSKYLKVSFENKNIFTIVNKRGKFDMKKTSRELITKLIFSSFTNYQVWSSSPCHVFVIVGNEYIWVNLSHIKKRRDVKDVSSESKKKLLNVRESKTQQTVCAHIKNIHTFVCKKTRNWVVRAKKKVFHNSHREENRKINEYRDSVYLVKHTRTQQTIQYFGFLVDVGII